jgi:Predicted nucleoside-diphosphate sugar epimerases
MIDDKSILITGGTGSFGKQFVKTILEHFKPKRLSSILVMSSSSLKWHNSSIKIACVTLSGMFGIVTV